MAVRRLCSITALLITICAVKAMGTDRFYPKPSSSDFPIYPERARVARVAGPVRLWFTVDEKGLVAEVQVISGNSMLRDAALATVRSWKFPPRSIHPHQRYETKFEFVLNVQQKEGEPKLTVSMTDFRNVEVASEFYAEAIE